MLDLGLERCLELRRWQDTSERVRAQMGTASYPLCDVVKQGRHVAHVCSGEDGVEHLALLLVGGTVCC